MSQPLTSVLSPGRGGIVVRLSPFLSRLGIPPKIPKNPVAPAYGRFIRKVTVVPNPFYDDGLHAYPNTRNIRFVGIPRKCTIYIYSASGDFVRALDQDETVVINSVTGKPDIKTANQKGEITWSQNTWNLSGFISAGLYYFVVVSHTPGSDGQTQRGTFLVIK